MRLYFEIRYNSSHVSFKVDYEMNSRIFRQSKLMFISSSERKLKYLGNIFFRRTKIIKKKYVNEVVY